MISHKPEGPLLTLTLPAGFRACRFNNADAREYLRLIINLFENQQSFVCSTQSWINHIGAPPEAKDFLFQHTFDLWNTVHVHTEWIVGKVDEKGL